MISIFIFFWKNLQIERQENYLLDKIKDFTILPSLPVIACRRSKY